MSTNFQDEGNFPRRGRMPMGKFLWLARVFDKARASATGTIGEYIYPCPIDKGMFERWGISSIEFDAAIREHCDDEAILNWAQGRVSEPCLDVANSWLVIEKFENLDRQDREEGAFAEASV